jgi:hypothetical protein
LISKSNFLLQHLSCVIDDIANLRLHYYKLKIVKDAENTTNLPLADAQNTSNQEQSPGTAATTRSKVKELLKKFVPKVIQM